MYRINKWIDALLLAAISGGVYFTMSSIYDDPVKWINALALFIAVFLFWAFISPHLFKNSKTKS